MDATLRIQLTAPADAAVGSVPTVQDDGSVAWQAPAQPRLDHQVTGNYSELVDTLPMNPSAFQVVYSLPVADIRDGDVIVALAEAEATNPHSYNAFVSGWLLLTDDPGAVNGIEISENSGFNITPQMHHGIVTKVGSVRPVGTDLGDRHVNVVMRAAASQAQEGDTLLVEQDYGRLTVLRWRR